MTAVYNAIEIPLFILNRVKQVTKPFELTVKFTDVDRRLDRAIYQATQRYGAR